MKATPAAQSASKKEKVTAAATADADLASPAAAPTAKSPAAEPAKARKTPKASEPAASVDATSPPAEAPVRLTDDYEKIIKARHHDPFSILGRHPKNDRIEIRVFLPHAETVHLGSSDGPRFERIHGTDFFIYKAEKDELPPHYKLAWTDKSGHHHENYDPYDFAKQLPDFDIHLFGEGKHWHIYQKLGAHLHQVDGIDGVFFAVWAPNAGRVSVVGDFNRWDGRCHPMRNLGGCGIWEIFIPGLKEGCL
ncbi:MAG TPA: hypothetical protein PLW66_15635, partial [Saprospiraceae bacterium]|nr:hypothetical protein [Saprospiraceae bacterium]